MIEKITDQNLERYDSRLKEWCDRKFFEKGNYGKYQTTEESGAVAFYPAPNTPLEGKVKFSFTETMPANGDKGPENPSTITGVSSLQISRTNKNLLSLPYHTTPGVRNGITWTVNSDGSITATGTAGTGGSVFYIAGSVAKVYLASGKTYFLSGTPTVNSWKTHIVVMGNSGSSHYYRADLGSGGTFVPDNDQLLCFAYVDAGVTVDNYTFRPQIEEGTEATSFEPIQRSQVTINLGSTYYGGEIDLATGVMTVTHVMSEIDGSVVDGGLDALTNTFPIVVHIPESILPSAEGYIIPSGCTCDKFFLANNQDDIEHIMLGQFYRYRQFRIYLSFSRCGIAQSATLEERVAAAKTWLNNNHVKLVLNLREDYRYTIQLTPQQILSLPQLNKYTPRLNTIYTDADSIQISYLKSPIRDEYEKTQAILSLGGNS